jgi:hypothetical protein
VFLLFDGSQSFLRYYPTYSASLGKVSNTKMELSTYSMAIYPSLSLTDS